MHINAQKNTHVTTFLLMIFLLFFISDGLAAQKNEFDEIVKFIKKERVNTAYGIGGINILDLAKLNTHLQETGLPELPAGYLCYGGGGYFVNQKLVFGGELIFLHERTTSASTEYNFSASAKLFLLNFGHLVYKKKGLMMYPFLGGGLGRFRLITAQNNIDSFNDISNLHKSSESKFTNFIINLGFATDYFLNYNPQKKGRNNIIIGFRLGFNFIPFRSTWKVNRISVPDGPDTGINGPYFRLVIGLGGWAERLIRKAIR